MLKINIQNNNNNLTRKQHNYKQIIIKKKELKNKNGNIQNLKNNH